MASPLSKTQIADLLARTDAGETNTQIARETGIGRNTVIGYANPRRKELIGYAVEHQSQSTEGDSPTEVDPTKRQHFSETEDGAELTFVTRHRIRTKEDAMKYGEIDPKEWVIKELKINSWETCAKNERLQEDKDGKIWKLKTPKHYQLWAVTVTLKPVAPKPYMEAVKLLFEDFKLQQIIATKRPKIKSDKVMFMMGLFDAHFGKHCWGEESGQDQDLKSAEVVYEDAFDDIRQRVSHITPELIIFPVGNDFLHVDNKKGETTSGTYVGMDSRLPKIIRTAFRAQYRVIDRAANLARVRLKIVPGNHGELADFYLAMYLEAKFENDPRVELDMSPRSRKYDRYGVTNLGFQHGHLIKPEKLPGIMMQEQRDELHGTKYSEWFTGHNHRTMKYEDTLQGTTIHSLQALSATDTWHFDRGFIGARRAAESYVYELADGYCGHWIATVGG